ncbi:mavicyanin-like [Cornus florida]|uniref:mavicyanin-like n=1 Tax=Cornus florida TaxID=4283 RepID=UPI002896CEC5|nr:mavicyanin-like [Cornus florida]
MGRAKLFIAALFVISVIIGVKCVRAEVHHLVAGDRGWDPSSDVASWSSGRTFIVGDKIWFSYSAAQESVVELKSKEEYESCDVSNPIRMYTDGIDSVTLDRKGIRYFASGKTESCKKGLKLHVEVQPQSTKDEIQAVGLSDSSSKAVAAGPTTPTPSASAQPNGLSLVLLSVAVGLLSCHVGL